MTLEEAIQHCHEVAAKDCTECGKEHLQLADWLAELKQRREDANRQPKTNGDRIRHMTDEELAALIANENDFCSLCAYKSDTLCTKQPTACTHGFYEWLQEVSGDAPD